MGDLADDMEAVALEEEARQINAARRDLPKRGFGPTRGNPEIEVSLGYLRSRGLTVADLEPWLVGSLPTGGMHWVRDIAETRRILGIEENG